MIVKKYRDGQLISQEPMSNPVRPQTITPSNNFPLNGGRKTVGMQPNKLQPTTEI